MIITFTIAQSVVLTSIFKPIVFGTVFALWGYAVGYIDKDLHFYYMRRQTWNGIHLGLGALGFGLWLLIPYFWVGLPLTLLFIGSGFVSYHFYRNQTVPEKKYWKFSLDNFKIQPRDSAKNMAKTNAAVVMLNPDGSPGELAEEGSLRFQIHQIFENLMAFALPRRAELFTMSATSENTLLSVQVDGMAFPQPLLASNLGVALIDYLKEFAGLDVKERRKQQIGSFKMVVAKLGKQTIKIQTLGSTKGISLTATVNPDQHQKIEFNNIGLLDSQKAQLQESFKNASGAVLVVCPPKHGLTTTLYSLLEQHDPYTENIMTIEKRLECELEGVTHQQLKIAAGSPTLSAMIKSTLLREPKVLMLCQLTDKTTAQQIQPHLDNMRSYIGIRQIDAFTALRAWVAAIGDARKAVDGVKVIMAQRLIRKLCPTCKIAYKPDPAILRKLNLSSDKVKQLYKHSGKVIVKEQQQMCETCMGLGYRGRIGIFEVMVLDDVARDAIVAGQLDHARAQMRKKRMLYLQEAGLNRVVEGVTSISEITRILTEEKKGK